MGGNSVSVFERDGSWVVCVIDAEKKHEREFSFEENARSFAAGQSKRQELEAKEPQPPRKIS